VSLFQEGVREMFVRVRNQTRIFSIPIPTLQGRGKELAD
jgi:hypothetical protein